MNKLAINGGPKTRTKLFPNQNTMGIEEENAVLDILRNGKKGSGYRGNYIKEFWGGEYVQKLIETAKDYFGTKYVIPCNSATSGLQIACGAIDLAPGDEVIVTPWSMSCSATAPLIWNAVPVFADIDPDTFCLDPQSIKDKITDKTKAILVVDLFGQSHNTDEINKIACEYGLKVICDSAQSVGSYRHGIPSGTLSDIGVYSLNYGKLITSGEGGIIVTDDEQLALKCQLIMNHAESVQRHIPKEINPGLSNMIGFNMRMTEITAAIANEQLKKIEGFVSKRHLNVNYLERRLNNIPAIKPYQTSEHNTNSYYVLPLKWDNRYSDGINRDKYIEAVKAELVGSEGRADEGVFIKGGYTMPLYKLPMFQNKRLYGGTSYPFNADIDYDLKLNICEKLQEEELICVFGMIGCNSGVGDMDDVCSAFMKVWEYREELR